MNLFDTVNFKIAKISKAVAISLALTCLTVGTAHSELSIQEEDPASSVTNQYDALKNADASSADLHNLIATLNQRVAANPNDSLAWELLAQIYYNNGYHAYAVYAANEAIESGYSTNTLQKILLNSSAIVSQSQLQADYLTDDVSNEFTQDYQRALSKIYGKVYGFNYDESLPKPPAPVVRPRAAKSKPKVQRAPTKRAAKPAKRRPAAKSVAKPKPRVAPQKPTRRAPARSNTPSSSDPFKILR